MKFKNGLWLLLALIVATGLAMGPSQQSIESLHKSLTDTITKLFVVGNRPKNKKLAEMLTEVQRLYLKALDTKDLIEQQKIARQLQEIEMEIALLR